MRRRMLLAIACVTLAGLAVARADQQAPTSKPPHGPVTPIVRIQLEKTRFLQTERIFLWMHTERARDETRPIPTTLLNNMRVVYTRPDGTTRIDRPSAMMDGMGINVPGDMGSQGGWTLGEEPQLGRWSVVYEMGSLRSAPVEFTVEAPTMFKEIDAHFEFPSPVVYGSTATLVVRNGTREALRFPEPGQNMSSISAHLRGAGFNSYLSVPTELLTSATGSKPALTIFLSLDWDSVRRVPHVTLAPGATWKLAIPLTSWVADRLAGAGGELTLSAELQMVIGDPGGEWAGFSPLRVVASGKAAVK